MADGVSILSSGTAAPTVGGAEVELANTTAPGLYKVDVDASAMQAGDTIELRYYSAVASGTQRQCKLWSFSNAQNGSTDALSPNKDFDARACGGPYGFKATLKQTAGVARTFPYVVTQVSP